MLILIVTGKLQAEVRRLQASLEEKRQSRLEFSEAIIQDARSRLETIRSSVGISLTPKYFLLSSL